MSSADQLSAEPHAIPRRDPARPHRLGDVGRVFSRYSSPKIIAVAFETALP